MQKFNKYTALIIFGFSAFFPALFPESAQAYQVRASVVCANQTGEQRTFDIGWDNSYSFFDGKGYIPRLFCEGGYGQGYTIYISDNLLNSADGYFNGLIQDTQTAIVETQTVVTQETVTATVDSASVVSESATVTVESPTVTVQDTVVATQETETVVLVPDSPTVIVSVPDDTQTVSVESVETQTLTSESSTQTNPIETSTQTTEETSQPIVLPLPTPIPVQPQPVPQPAPQPQPDPVVESEVVEILNGLDEEAPSEEQPLEEQPVVEEQPPAEVQIESPLEEEQIDIPIQDAPLEQTEPKIQPSPEPSAIPAPAFQPDKSQTPPTVTLDNGVTLTQEVAEQMELLQNPSELVTELLTNPAAVLSALSNIGADMSPEARVKSKKVVISAVIAGNIATQTAAIGAAAYRRKP